LAEFNAYLATLEESSLPHAHLSHLLNYLTSENAETLKTLSSLLEHAEITFDLLWALYVPKKTVLYIPCPLTGEPRTVRLVNAEKYLKQEIGLPPDVSGLSINSALGDSSRQTAYIWRLVVEYLDADVDLPGVHFGYAKMDSVIDIPGFAGTKEISALGVYPIEYYAGFDGLDGLKARLIERGRKWAGLTGNVSHLAYKGIAHVWLKSGTGQSAPTKFKVCGHRNC
jgi:hypothetical protein